MTIHNPSKIPAKVMQVMTNRLDERAQGVTDFLGKSENSHVDFPALWDRVVAGNERFFKNQSIDESLAGQLTREEMLFLARMLRFSTEYVADQNQKRHPISPDIIIEQTVADGVSVEWQTVPGADEDRVLLYLHGGGWLLGSPNDRRLLTTALGRETGMRILSVDYRMAPEHPHPAPLEDCTAVYQWLLSEGIKSENIFIGGDSAGGHLTLTTMINLRTQGISLPAGGILIAPATDLALSDPRYFQNGETDPVLADVGLFWWLLSFLSGADTRDPLVSPLYDTLEGLPPLLFQVSSSEMLYSDSIRCAEKAEKAGGDVILQTWEDTLHVFQAFGLFDLPEARDAITKIGNFVSDHSS
ncbi:MAG: alpha/beta hydrolase [Deltaproteobacteria bacterium]|nr:alpha/beta hydrolase [Deltaproteobacteria bacterium]